MEHAVSHDQATDECIVTRDPRILGGALIVARKRIPLAYVVSFGDTPEGHQEAHRNYPTLTLEQIEAAFAYARAHPELDVWS
jgi:uncharacterized protein (DUF433 family)